MSFVKNDWSISFQIIVYASSKNVISRKTGLKFTIKGRHLKMIKIQKPKKRTVSKLFLDIWKREIIYNTEKWKISEQ